MASSVLRFAVKCPRPVRLVAQTDSYVSKRLYDRYRKNYLKEMYNKRLEVGPDKPRRRADWINWNYDCEIFAFGKRLGEEFEESLLRQAFVHRSYVDQETQKRSELGLDFDSLPMELEDNSELASSGEKILSRYLKAYLRNVYPYMFEECITSIHNSLVADETLSHVAFHLGCEDLVLCKEYPPVHQSTLSQTFKALVGVLEQCGGQERAETFVRDFVLPQLIGKDINEMWSLHNPMGLLVACLGLAGRGEPEPRLLWKSGSSTMMSLYWVGIYSDKQLISKAPGETLLIAEEMAAREAIKTIMRTEDSRPPLPRDILDLDHDRINSSAEDLIKKWYQVQRGESEESAQS